MRVNEISKYNFVELNKVTKTPENNNQSNSTNEVKDRFQKGLNIQNITYSNIKTNIKKNSILTQEEKDFFSKLYPKSANEINSYQTFSNPNLIKGNTINIKG